MVRKSNGELAIIAIVFAAMVTFIGTSLVCCGVLGVARPSLFKNMIRLLAINLNVRKEILENEALAHNIGIAVIVYGGILLISALVVLYFAIKKWNNGVYKKRALSVISLISASITMLVSGMIIVFFQFYAMLDGWFLVLDTVFPVLVILSLVIIVSSVSRFSKHRD